MIALIVVMFCVGWALSTWRPVSSAVTAVLDRWVIMVALPAVIVSTMSRVDLDSALLVPVAGSWAVMAACAMMVALAGRLARWPAPVTGALLCVAVLGNTSFMGLGMVEGLLGSDHLAAAIAYDQLGTFLALSMWVPVVVRMYGRGAASEGASTRGGAWSIAASMVRFPPFVALLVSVVVRFTSLPEFAFDAMEAIAPTVAPVAMFTVGLRFRARLAQRVVAPALTGLAVKMVIVPAIVAAIVVVGGRDGDLMWSTTLLQSAAPPMVTAGLVAIAGGLDDEVTSFIVGAGTLAGFLWVPTVSLLL